MPGYRINSPVLSSDGKRLYFLAAEHDSAGIDQNDRIWYVDRTTQGWSDPVCLPKEVNGVPKHFQFSVDGNGSVYFGGENADLYVAGRNLTRPYHREIVGSIYPTGAYVPRMYFGGVDAKF